MISHIEETKISEEPILKLGPLPNSLELKHFALKHDDDHHSASPKLSRSVKYDPYLKIML